RDVVKGLRPAFGPCKAGQALAKLVVDLLAGGVQLLEPVARAVPGRAADQHLAGRQPHLAHGAAGEVADGLDGAGRGPPPGPSRPRPTRAGEKPRPPRPSPWQRSRPSDSPCCTAAWASPSSGG